ncbi:formate C-acetyltransferase [Eubacterium coprostanoligenes]|uniref:formate C-acetyltransferase n=1 Tax=Eubacterium coprostanoligenes TaxID=290054 RepID=UPI00235618FF|nr:formate C-acetyltransferase [Eubacterium coprostanoligenes]MCI6254269.1 formate C-acetyltransferase [Eubacterium coprostanoligenes]MCI6354519.1 formate C-acetyltransferase [Eubacterium coprostanoligenes]MCI6360421.1 formate C-acetyltransferase [Eubacterium coprostanoligenes]MCI7265250.1 formate C-acetyltransferase [Eubacterium coprostanoligenes]MDD7358431.1 formate C-acetyltransferase [Eubacterium coprostanoligenes]
MEAWRNFNTGVWCDQIDVSNFIKMNYTPYDGDSSFLQGPTERTERTMKRVNELLIEENKKGGVLDVDTERVLSILSHDAGYVVDKDTDIIVGLQTDAPLKRGVSPFAGLRNTVQACNAYGYELSEKIKDEFTYRTTHNTGVFRAYTDTMKAARHAGILTGLPDAYARGRIIGDYRRIALYGMDYLIEQKKLDKKKMGEKEVLDEDTIHNLEDLSKQLDFMNQLKGLALRYGYDISKPATTAKEAIQWLYFGYLGAIKEQNGAANSIGRIAEFIDIYIQRDIEEGVLDEVHAQELIDDLVVKLRLVRHLRTPEYNDLFAGDPVWVTMALAGVTGEGKHMVSKTSFRVLQTLYNLGSSAEPNITVLWSDRLPEGFKKFCAQVSIDTDSIQYENDDVMRRMYGDDYSIACCVSAMKTGKQMQFFGARCNLAKVLLMALNGGKDEIEGHQIAPVGEVFEEKELSYDEVYAAYKKYLSWMARLYVNTMNIIHYMHDKYAYERLMMSLHDTDVERLMAFGVSGFSVAIDSLSAIKYAKVTPVKDDRGIITDFKVEGKFPKYGNDDDRADLIGKDLIEYFYHELCKTPCYRGARHTLSILTITSNVMYGRKTGSTPDGRKAGEPFAPGANPMHGRDCEGALASLNSVAKLNYACCQDGISNTFSITPDALGTDEDDRIEHLTTMLDGYFEQDAHHLNVNVLNREKLIAAMEDPTLYPSLTIRVSGYAVNFNKLTRDKQEEVIARTFHQSM